MSDYSAYIQEVMDAGVNPVHIRHEIRELCQALLHENILIEKIWFAISGYPCKELHALCCDEDDELYEAIACWEYDDSQRGKPGAHHYELVSLELVELDGTRFDI